jgi:hypothetical protein
VSCLPTAGITDVKQDGDSFRLISRNVIDLDYEGRFRLIYRLLPAETGAGEPEDISAHGPHHGLSPSPHSKKKKKRQMDGF